MTNLTRYTAGVVTQTHRGRGVTTSTGSNSFDQYTKHITKITKVKEGFVPAGFENRPDLIADLFYNSSAEWWRVMVLNNVPDPFEGFNLHDRILFPD